MKWIAVCLGLLYMSCQLAVKTSSYKPPTIIPGGEITVTPILKIAGNFSDVEVDALGNIYLLKPTGTLIKYNAAGDSTGVYNDVKNMGQPTSIDVRNPFKILLFYKSFTSISVLDKYLRELQLINLRTIGTFRVQTAAVSYDNDIWIFDEEGGRLKKLNELLQTVIESPDVRQLQHDIPSVVKIIDHNNFVYLYDDANGLYVFDYYGALKNVYPIKALQGVNINNGALYGFRHQTMIMIDMDTFQETPMDVNITGQKIVYSGDRLYVLRPEGITVYTRV